MPTSKTVLVTGITGFVGSRAAARFIQAGIQVRGLVRKMSSFPGVEQVIGDLSDLESLSQAAEGAQVVLHCAASFSDSFAEARQVNIEGTRHLARAALLNGCERFIHVSTCGAYNLVGQDLVDENTPLWDYDENTSLIYGVTKAEAERVVFQYMDQGLPAVILRPPNILGAHPRSSFAAEFIQLVKDGQVKLGSDGSNTWPYVHIENFIDAVMEVLHRPQAVGQAYNIVDGHTTFREFVSHYAKWLGVDLHQRPMRPPYDFFYGRFSVEKAQKDLDYTPKYSYEQAMEETHQFLQETGMI